MPYKQPCVRYVMTQGLRTTTILSGGGVFVWRNIGAEGEDEIYRLCSRLTSFFYSNEKYELASTYANIILLLFM